MQSENFLRVFKGAERWLELPKGSIAAVCGAGGKTTFIHMLTKWYRQCGLSVLATTSTHMMNEGDLCENASEAEESILRTGYAFAGRVDPGNASKIVGLPDRERTRAFRAADIVLIEADGARHCSVKVPYSHEPVIYPEVGKIAVLYGKKAIGASIKESTYNIDGMISLLSEQGQIVTEDSILDESMIRYAVNAGYERALQSIKPNCSFDLIAGNTEESRWII